MRFVRFVPVLTVALVAAAFPSVPSQAESAQRAVAPRHINYRTWTTDAALKLGTLSGVRLSAGNLTISKPVAKRTYDDPHGQPTRTYDESRWTSPWTGPGFGLNELVASWDATTPLNTWIEVTVRGKTSTGRLSSWDTLARWSSSDGTFRRTTISPQSDDLAKVNVDTWVSAAAAGFTSYQLRVNLLRRTGTTATPTVDSIGAMASRLPKVSDVPTSAPGVGRGKTLNVPSYSQMTHSGHYPKWGGGGEAWCSPTSTSMVLGYYKALPTAKWYSWVPKGHTDPWVDYAARSTYDYAYQGTGNWPFNTAYAANRGVAQSFVTRLRSLREAELFIARGIPLVVSISFARGELDGAPISSTNGHLLVIVGFTAAGNVIVNDPASKTRAGVRRTYNRAQFEDVWVPKSGGLTYVIRDAKHPLPSRGSNRNW